jgi:hypothetical protein
MECMPILNIPSFDCFCSIFIYFAIGLGALFGAGSLLKG